MVEQIHSFEQFWEDCTANGVGLDPRIGIAAESGTTGGGPMEGGPTAHYFPPGQPEYIAVTEAGRLLSMYPKRPLSNKLVDCRRLRAASLGLRTLGTMIIDSHFHYKSAETIYDFDSEWIGALDTPRTVEREFAETLGSIISSRRNDTRSFQLLGANLWNFKRMLFLRTNSAQAPSLSLAPVTVNGIRYPAGSAFRIRLFHDWQQIGWQPADEGADPGVPAVKREVLTNGKIARIAFLRLTGFALEPGERPDFGISNNRWSKRARDIYGLRMSGILDRIEESGQRYSNPYKYDGYE